MTTMRTDRTTCLVGLLLAAALPALSLLAGKQSPSKKIDHTQRTVEGWTVHVDNKLLGEEKALGEQILRRDTGRNRVMNVTYRFAGFRPVEEAGDVVIFEHDLRQIPAVPDYVMLRSVDDELGAGGAPVPA